MEKYILAVLVLLFASCSEIGPKGASNPEETRDPQRPIIDDDYQHPPVEGLSTLKTPTLRLELKDWPKIYDDLDFARILIAIDRQIQKFERIQVKSNIRLGDITYGPKIFINSLKAYRKLVVNYQACTLDYPKEECQQHFERHLAENFYLFYPEENGRPKKTLFTAYHTPTMEASLEKSSRFPAGIHSKPKESHLQRLSRNEINFDGALEGTPYELLFIKDFFDQYLLHIQGGGKVVYKNQKGKKEAKYLNYNGTNRRSFRFISIYMRDQGYIDDLSVATQRRFLERHPEKQEEIYAYSPSYVYFQLSDEPPHGNDAVPLTDNRSIATDYRIYKLKGLMTLVQAKRPLRNNDGSLRWVKMSRFKIDHDTGGAIKGAARADLYFGEDDYAAFVATQMKRRGDLYFLALKP